MQWMRYHHARRDRRLVADEAKCARAAPTSEPPSPSPTSPPRRRPRAQPGQLELDLGD